MTREEVFIWCRKQYGTEPDYPWADPNAVLRHKDTRKWYGLVMEVARDKLGLPGDGAIRVLNVKCEPLLIGSLREKPGFLPASHMNKECAGRGGGKPAGHELPDDREKSCCRKSHFSCGQEDNSVTGSRSRRRIQTVDIERMAGCFFHNQKTLDETAAIIQNRVQLYLNESN